MRRFITFDFLCKLRSTRPTISSTLVSKFHLSWLKDGRPVLKMPRIRVTKLSTGSSPSSAVARDGKAVLAEAELFVTNVQKEDGGAYQCVVGVARLGELQASAELRLGGEEELQGELAGFNTGNAEKLREIQQQPTMLPGFTLTGCFSFSGSISGIDSCEHTLASSLELFSSF